MYAIRNAVDPADAYRAFRGRDPEVDVLMRDRRFPVPGSEQTRVVSTGEPGPDRALAAIRTLWSFEDLDAPSPSSYI